MNDLIVLKKARPPDRAILAVLHGCGLRRSDRRDWTSRTTKSIRSACFANSHSSSLHPFRFVLPNPRSET